MTRLELTILLCAVALQQVDAQGASAFRAESRLVRVDVSVQGARGEIITDLAQAAFTVYENGTAQPIALFLQDDIPVSLGLVIDNSGSMRTRRAKVEAAALAFARASNPLDEMFVVNFADTAHLDVPFTSDVRVLEDGIARMDSIGGTALRDAVAMAVAYLGDHATRDHKILLVITDGGDNSSAISNDAVRERAERAGIALYAIGVPQADASKAARRRHELDDLTERTGGAAIHPATLDEVEPVAIRLAHQVRRRYTLAYVPLNQSLDGSYRKIRVVVKASEPVSVQSRAGYYATLRK